MMPASDKKLLIRILIYSVAILITGGSLIYSNHLVRQLAEQEEKRVQLYADALEFTGTVDENCETGFVFDKITKENALIPTILVDDNGNINFTHNLDIPEDMPDAERKALESEALERMQELGNKITIEFYGTKNHIYYDESEILKQLRIYPYLQLILILVFISVIFIGYVVAKKSEQNKVWIGLAKETAHQLGTPVSSLMAWAELLKLKMDNPEDAELIRELEKDIHRLSVVTERFSKIGSVPELKPNPLDELIQNIADYMQRRISKKGLISISVKNESKEKPPMALVNPPLFEWVIENLMKNALDAMGESGKIEAVIQRSGNNYLIDVTDTGKGIPKGMQKQVFQPGFTTKKRGWGLGLSLTKRIVENYHKGKIFVKASEPGKGTTFRIIIPAAE